MRMRFWMVRGDLQQSGHYDDNHDFHYHNHYNNDHDPCERFLR